MGLVASRRSFLKVLVAAVVIPEETVAALEEFAAGGESRLLGPQLVDNPGHIIAMLCDAYSKFVVGQVHDQYWFIVSPDNFDAFYEALLPIARYTHVATAEKGFMNLMIKGIPVSPDEDVSGNRIKIRNLTNNTQQFYEWKGAIDAEEAQSA